MTVAGQPYSQGRPGRPDNQMLVTEEMRQLLGRMVMAEVTGGGRVESHNDYGAVIVFGRNPNHALHAVLTFLTCFMWSVVWLVIAFTQKETRVTLSWAPDGSPVRWVHK
ncbi:hypothetical protein [Nocardia sp. NPDC003963]